MFLHEKLDNQPIRKRNKIFDKETIKWLTRELKRLINLGIIKVLDSLWHVAPSIAKKANRDLRFTLNLIPIND